MIKTKYPLFLIVCSKRRILWIEWFSQDIQKEDGIPKSVIVPHAGWRFVNFVCISYWLDFLDQLQLQHLLILRVLEKEQI